MNYPIHFRSRTPSIVFLLGLSSAFAAVDSTVNRLSTASIEPREGMPYFLPKPVLVFRTSPELDAAGKVKSVKVEIEKQVVADRDRGFVLNLNNDIFTAATTSFEIDEGLLSSLNDAAEGKLGEALQSIASFVFSLQTIPALKAQSAALSESLKSLPTPPGDRIKATVSAIDQKVPAETAFLEYIDRSDYGSVIKELIVNSTDVDLLLIEARDELVQNGQPITFEQIMAGVDTETLKKSFVHAKALASSPGPLELGDRLRLEVSMDFGDSATAESTFAAPTSWSSPNPGGIRRPPSAATSRAYSDRIFVRSERPVSIHVQLKPNPTKVADLMRESLKANLITPAKLIQAKKIKDEASWKTALDEFKTAAKSAADAAEQAEDRFLAQLDTRFQAETDLAEGRAQLNVAILPLLTKLKAAQIEKSIGKADEATVTAKALGADFDNFRKDAIKNIIKIYLIGTEGLALKLGGEYSTLSVVTTFPSPEAYQLPIERLITGKTNSGLKLSRGMIRSLSLNRAAPAAELVAIPSKIVEPYISLLKELISIKVNRIQQSDDAITQKVAIAKLEKEFEDLAKGSDPNAVAHTEAVENLTRTKQLLELEKNITELRKAMQTPQPPDAATVAHDSLVTSLQRRKQILELQAEIAKLPGS